MGNGHGTPLPLRPCGQTYATETLPAATFWAGHKYVSLAGHKYVERVK